MGKKAKKEIQMKPAFGKHFGVSPQSKFTHCNHFNLNLNDGDVLPTVWKVLFNCDVKATDHGLHHS